MADDDMPEMKPSKFDARRTLSNARARALQHFKKRTVWDAMDEEMFEVVVDLKMLRELGDEDGRKFALRELSQLWCRMPTRPALPPEAGIVPGSDEWRQRCKDAEQDAAVRAFLVEQGWTAPTASKEKN